MSKRRKFSWEFMREAVGLIRQRVDRSVGWRARSMWARGLSAVGVASGDPPGKGFSGSDVPRDQEVTMLERELVRVVEERDFSRDALAFFARGGKRRLRRRFQRWGHDLPPRDAQAFPMESKEQRPARWYKDGGFAMGCLRD